MKGRCGVLVRVGREGKIIGGIEERRKDMQIDRYLLLINSYSRQTMMMRSATITFLSRPQTTLFSSMHFVTSKLPKKKGMVNTLKIAQFL